MEYVISGILITLLTITGLYVWWHRKTCLYWEKRGVPHEKSLSSIFRLYKIFTTPVHELLLDGYKKYGRIYGGFEFRKPIITVCEPHLLRDILVKDFHIFNYRRDFDAADDLVSKMVSLLKGEDWKRVRTIITPAFTSKRMRQMTHIINECSNSVVETLEKYAEKGEPADLKSIFGAFTLDVIASAAFATKIDSLNDPQNIFVKHVKSIFTKPSVLRILAFVLLPSWLMKKLGLTSLPSTDFFKNVISQVIKERKETGKKYDDMLQLLLEAQEEFEKGKSIEAKNSDFQDETDQYGSVTNSGMISHLKYKKLSEDELVAQCVLFFLVGYETTASTLAFMAYLLALNKECQEKLTTEVDEAFEKHKEVNYDVIRDMKYLDCVVSETLRMYPTAPRAERTACEDYKLGNTGITIEKGTIVGFNIHAMHHDPEFFPNPEKFYPERFLNENATHPPYTYLPFGEGPRNCLGMRFALMEIKLCISHILRNYTLKKAERTKVPLEFKLGTGFISVDELPLVVERRNISQ